MGRALCVALLAAATGCTTIGHDKVEGWPVLAIVEHRVHPDVIHERCGKYVGFAMTPLACAEFDLAARRCDVWLMAGFAPRVIVEHERLHCLGYDHPGANSMAELLRRHRAKLGG